MYKIAYLFNRSMNRTHTHTYTRTYIHTQVSMVFQQRIVLPFLFRQRTMSLILYKRILSYDTTFKRERKKKITRSSMLSRSYDKFSSVSYALCYTYIYIISKEVVDFHRKNSKSRSYEGIFTYQGINKTRIHTYIAAIRARQCIMEARNRIFIPREGKGNFRKKIKRSFIQKLRNMNLIIESNFFVYFIQFILSFR